MPSPRDSLDVSLKIIWISPISAAIGNARVAGLEKDLHLKGNDFYIALTIF